MGIKRAHSLLAGCLVSVALAASSSSAESPADGVYADPSFEGSEGSIGSQSSHIVVDPGTGKRRAMPMMLDTGADEYLAAENEILRSKLNGRPRLTNSERMRLAKLGKPQAHDPIGGSPSSSS